MTKDDFNRDKVIQAFDMLLYAIREVENVWGGYLRIGDESVTDIMNKTYPEKLPDFIEVDSCLYDWAHKVINEVSK